MTAAEIPTYDLYIGGRREKPVAGQYFASDNPYTGEVWARVARGSAEDVERAVQAATVALPVWNGLKPAERGRLLLKLSELVEANAERLAALEVRDNGKLYLEMLPQMRLVAE